MMNIKNIVNFYSLYVNVRGSLKEKFSERLTILGMLKDELSRTLPNYHVDRVIVNRGDVASISVEVHERGLKDASRVIMVKFYPMSKSVVIDGISIDFDFDGIDLERV